MEHVHLHLSNSAFERLIKSRLQQEFRPIDEPFDYQQQPCYMDGLHLTSVTFDASPRPFEFVLNEQRSNRSVVSSGRALTISPLRATVRGAILLTTTAAVRAASVSSAQGIYGLPERPEPLRIPILGAEIDVFFTVNEHGVPTLNVPVRTMPGSELLGDVPTFLGPLQNLTLPFAVGDAFSEVLANGLTRVVNAGIVHTGDGIIIRLEFEPVPDDNAFIENQRGIAWFDFFQGQHPSQLAGTDWAIEVPTKELGAKAAKELDDQFGDPDVAKHVQSSGKAGAWFDPAGPGFFFRKDAVLLSACAGLDVRASIEATATFSVPSPNTLRTSVDLDADLDDWDSFKCTVLSILNPFAGAITAYDKGLPWYGVPLLGAAMPLVPIAWGLGVDDLAMKEVIKKAQEAAGKKGGPAIVRTSLNTFYIELTKQITTELTRDWMVIDAVGGIGDRLVIRGRFTAPDLSLLPRLRGTLSDPFEFWSKKNRCSSNVEWETVATLALELVDDTQKPVKPPLPVRYGINIETVDGKKTPVGNVTWRIVDDTTGVYGSSATAVHWTGAPPGVFEVQVTHPPEPYRSAPVPFRMQLFTSYGVREFEIPAPPPMPKPPQTKEEQILEAAERISNCYIYSTLLTRVKALQVFWLPNPPPETEFDVAQHWQILIRGLASEDRIRAWEPEARRLLAEVTAYTEGLTELSLTLQPEQAIEVLQLTLNDAKPLSLRTYAKRAGAVRGRKATGPYEILIRQTPLYLVADVPLAEPAEKLLPQRNGDVLRLLAEGPAGVQQVDLDAFEPRLPAVTARLDAGFAVRPQVPSARIRVERQFFEGRHAIELREPAVGGDRVVARYFARPWYDRGGVAGQFFAQLDDDGETARVFARGATRDVPPDIGDRDDGEPRRPRRRTRVATPA